MHVDVGNFPTSHADIACNVTIAFFLLSFFNPLAFTKLAYSHVYTLTFKISLWNITMFFLNAIVDLLGKLNVAHPRLVGAQVNVAVTV